MAHGDYNVRHVNSHRSGAESKGHKQDSEEFNSNGTSRAERKEQVRDAFEFAKSILR